MASAETSEMILKGISGSPGICIGRAYLVDKEGVDVIEKYHIPKDQATKEVNRFKQAVCKAKSELAQIIADLPEDLRQQASILETHMLLHKDKMLYEKTINIIKTERVNAEWALKEATFQAKSIFNNIADPYLRSRSADIEHVSDRIMCNLTGFKDINISNIDKRVILVAHSLSPAETSQIQLEKIMGFITDRGGVASHTSIIARTLEIPAVLGLDSATRMIGNGDIIIVDGTAGIVIINPEDETLIKYSDLGKRYEAHKADILRIGFYPATSADGRLFQVMGNIERPEEIVAVRDHGGDGIGLFRTEFQYMGRTSFPDEQELFNHYREVVELMAPHPVTIRTLDINGDKEISAVPTPEEANPALGLRAIRFCLRKPEIFTTQIRAILRAAAHGSGPDAAAHDLGMRGDPPDKKNHRRGRAGLRREGLECGQDVQIGIMIEVPSAVIMAGEMAELVDFFSIGTNDLVQYTLAIDRVNRHVAYLYNPLHPAVIRMIRHVVDAGREKKIKTFMCGEMASEPINLPILIGLGIDELSMAPQSIPGIKDMIRKIRVDESESLVRQALKLSTTESIIELINDRYGSLLNRNFKQD